MKKITVKAARSYEVIIERGILKDCGELIKAGVLSGGKILAVTDDTVEKLYLRTVTQSLKNAGFEVFSFVIAHGEQSKNTENLIKLCEFLAENGFMRTDAVLALGGGVTGDLAGFAAAIYMRGIKLIQMPTTLLSAVDSSVGGKTAVDLKAGKNLAGAFYQPHLVLCDPDTLKTLPEDIYADGCAEVIKYGAIKSRELLSLINRGIKNNEEEIIGRCVEIKRDVVSADEFDTGERQLLNFGHTLAHAIEAESGYGISHGSAVAAGMCLMARAAACAGICDARLPETLTETVKNHSLPDSTSFPLEKLMPYMLRDKKFNSGYITAVVPVEAGRCILKKMTADELKAFFAAVIK